MRGRMSKRTRTLSGFQVWLWFAVWLFTTSIGAAGPVNLNPPEGDPAFRAFSLFAPSPPPEVAHGETVVVLHGFGSALPNGTFKRVYQALHKSHWVVGFNYDPWSPGKSFAYWDEEIAPQLEGKRVTVLGTSLGGWWAWQLGNRAGVDRIVMINPVIEPGRYLRKYIGESRYVARRKATYLMTEAITDAYAAVEEPAITEARELLVLARDDEQLDYRWAQTKFAARPDARVVIFDHGGHTLDLKSHPAKFVILGFVHEPLGGKPQARSLRCLVPSPIWPSMCHSFYVSSGFPPRLRVDGT